MTTPFKRSDSRAAVEQPTDLLFWLRNGSCGPYHARVEAKTELSIGRTDSERALGFIVTRGKTCLDFVLDRDQVDELAAYLQIARAGLRKPLGRKPEQLSFVAMARAAQARKRSAKRRKAVAK
jgi:hypothetical protein